jgi:hypothetical protein
MMRYDSILRTAVEIEHELHKIYALLEISHNEKMIKSFNEKFIEYQKQILFDTLSSLKHCSFCASNNIPMPWESGYEEAIDKHRISKLFNK